MNYEEALACLEPLKGLGTKLGLERIGFVLESMGNPEKELRFIHVTGTNGKGSVCAMLGSVLREAGYRTGIFTSPHLIDVRERITVDGEMITKEDFACILSDLKEVTESMDPMEDGSAITYFEVMTAIALEHFRRKGCDIVVLETGLGGRLDATNVVDPLISVITNVSLDHTAYLGGDIESIAREKAGIIKPGRPIVTNAKPPALGVIESIARERGCELAKAGGRAESISSGLGGQSVRWEGMEMKLPLLGDFQLENLETALEAIKVLRKSGIDVEDGSVKKGIESTRWPGRMEVVGCGPMIVMDCAHNPAGAKATAAFVSTLGRKNIVVVMGVLDDKDYSRMLDEFSPIASDLILTKPDTERALDPGFIASDVSNGFVVEPDIGKALEAAKELAGKGGLVLVAGSVYLVGAVKSIINGCRD